MIPGEYILLKQAIACNTGRYTCFITVMNTGDRPVQVGSHFHFFEVNRQMEFDRKKALGMRLNIASGTAIRFEPGEAKQIELVAFGGAQMITGFSNLVNGNASDQNIQQQAMDKLALEQFKNKPA